MSDGHTRPLYVPPAPDSDAPLDAIELAWVEALIADLVREIRAEMAAGAEAGSDDRDTERGRAWP